LNLERLTDYEQEEASQFDQYLKRLGRGEAETYPGPERFRHLNQPVAKRAVDVSIWPQIPLYGSLLVHLSPVKESDFSKVHLFDASDLPDLVQLCKDTGRVQFTLAARPTMFEDLDYLDIVLDELRPPVVRALPVSAFFDAPSIRMAGVEFDTLARGAFWPWLKSILRGSGYDSAYATQNYETLQGVYSMLKLLGYEKTADEISGSLVDDLLRAHRILYLYNVMVQGPMLDTMREVYCFSRHFMKGMKEIPSGKPEARTFEFPFEIGAFLLDSPVLAPGSLEACEAVTERYNRIPRLVDDLEDALGECKSDRVTSASNALKAALHSTWEDFKPKGAETKGVTHGIGLGLAVGGSCARESLGGTAGGNSGLLSGLGYSLTNKSLESPTEEVSASAARLLSRSYTMSIFNPQKKYRLGKG
jgi:hypothetical protein